VAADIPNSSRCPAVVTLIMGEVDVAAMEVVPPGLKMEAVVTTPPTAPLEPQMDIQRMPPPHRLVEC
jgi:hypothetical protein